MSSFYRIARGFMTVFCFIYLNAFECYSGFLMARFPRVSVNISLYVFGICAVFFFSEHFLWISISTQLSLHGIFEV